MGSNIVVKMNAEDSNLVERLYYEHESGKATLAFLMRENGVDDGLFEKYVGIVDKRFYELEIAKQEMSKKYEPTEAKGLAYDYSFDFDNESLVYMMK